MGFRDPTNFNDEVWPKSDECWVDFMLRKHSEEQGSSKVAIIVACLIFLPVLVLLIVEELDKVLK